MAREKYIYVCVRQTFFRENTIEYACAIDTMTDVDVYNSYEQARACTMSRIEQTKNELAKYVSFHIGCFRDNAAETKNYRGDLPCGSVRVEYSMNGVKFAKVWKITKKQLS